MRPQLQTWLFDKTAFSRELTRFVVSPAHETRTRAGLSKLRARYHDKTFRLAGPHKITEVRAQQAFNALLFEEILGYHGVLGSRVPYSLLPELTHGPMRSDLSIGSFSRTSAHVGAVVELKSPGADLFAPQPGPQYRSKRTLKQLSPVAQVLEAMDYAKADWALVSNMISLLLIHQGARRIALSIDLLVQPADVALLHFGFGPGGFLPDATGTCRLDLLRTQAKKRGHP